ncbi:MAG: BatA domain-containing protein [Pirellulales bacterium]|nr:BatA domain-containing protein [Pirellulales bacterium]
MTFLFQSLLVAGLPLVGLPLLIHLINLRRRRRVQWAAMDFLLESQKRNKKWIMLRQLLLLLFRTAAIAAVVMMLAGPVLQSDWGRFFGKGITHHLVLLDDSYSMSDRWDQTTALAEAKRAVTVLLDQATSRAGSQQLTLLRFSQAAELSTGGQTEQFAQTLDRRRFAEVAEELMEMQATETDAGPLEAIQAVLGLPEAAEDETRIVYLISDYRRPQWRRETEIEQAMGRLRKQVDQLHVIQCVDQSRPNLAITRLAPESGVRAAGVETWMELSVTNYGDQSAVGIVAGVAQDGHRLPAVQFEEIEPGKEITRRFRTTFPSAGSYQLTASLDTDSIEVDNVRYFACEVPGEFPVLIIDGSRQGDDGFYLRTALSPGGSSKPGWNPQVEQPQFLRQHEKLSHFAAICLLDVARLDRPEVVALEEYVQQGGGLALFLGPQVQRPFYNAQLYRDGAGMLPVPLDVPTQMLSESEAETPDVQVSDHRLFRVFGGRRNTFLEVVAVNVYYAIDPQWRLPKTGATQILATLRNGAPYILDHQFGEGRVVTQLSKLSPRESDLGVWSNWSLNPAFPVYANELIGFLSSTQRLSRDQEVGTPLVLQVAEADYQPEVRVQMPQAFGKQATTIIPRAERGQYHVDAGRTEVSGVWQFELQPRGGVVERRLVAVNVSAGEGDLHHLDRAQLAQRLEGIDYEFSLAADMRVGDTSLAGYQLQDTLIAMLLLLLIVEQWFAYQASYHSSSTKSAA